MATSQGAHIDAMFATAHVPVSCAASPDPGFLHDDLNFELSRTETSGTDMEPIFGLSTRDWVTSQSFVSNHDGLAVDPWNNVADPHGTVPMWSLASNMAPSISEFTQLTDTISNSSSPVTSASIGEIEGSCSPELIMPPLAMAPSVFDPIPAQGSLQDFDQWDVNPAAYLPVDQNKAILNSADNALGSEPGRQPADAVGRRHTNESDPQKARSDVRYGLPAGPDGLYHCPFDGCTHSPDKLKCNYDKHLDSHLKPYRCKVQACQEVHFSSTACVLRHEREAHGMHGHGNKPFICEYPDCERANPENGFPRRWNLYDHMKRMHGHSQKAGTNDVSEVHAAGPIRTKRASRSSPKPRISKDDTIKASSSRKNSRAVASKAWLDQQAICASPIYDADYGTGMDLSKMSPSDIYGPWSSMQ